MATSESTLEYSPDFYTGGPGQEPYAVLDHEDPWPVATSAEMARDRAHPLTVKDPRNNLRHFQRSNQNYQKYLAWKAEKATGSGDMSQFADVSFDPQMIRRKGRALVIDGVQQAANARQRNYLDLNELIPAMSLGKKDLDGIYNKFNQRRLEGVADQTLDAAVLSWLRDEGLTNTADQLYWRVRDARDRETARDMAKTYGGSAIDYYVPATLENVRARERNPGKLAQMINQRYGSMKSEFGDRRARFLAASYGLEFTPSFKKTATGFPVYVNQFGGAPLNGASSVYMINDRTAYLGNKKTGESIYEDAQRNPGKYRRAWKLGTGRGFSIVPSPDDVPQTKHSYTPGAWITNVAAGSGGYGSFRVSAPEAPLSDAEQRRARRDAFKAWQKVNGGKGMGAYLQYLYSIGADAELARVYLED